MKKYRRIEITAFRRRVTIISGVADSSPPTEGEVVINDADAQETIEPESAEGRRLLLEAVRLLEEKLSVETPPEKNPPSNQS